MKCKYRITGCICSGYLSWASSAAGYSFITWQYWVFAVPVMIYLVIITRLLDMKGEIL